MAQIEILCLSRVAKDAFLLEELPFEGDTPLEAGQNLCLSTQPLPTKCIVILWFGASRGVCRAKPSDSIVDTHSCRSGLEGQLLGVTIQHEQPELEKAKSEMLQQEEGFKVTRTRRSYGPGQNPFMSDALVQRG